MVAIKDLGNCVWRRRAKQIRHQVHFCLENDIKQLNLLLQYECQAYLNDIVYSKVVDNI